MYGWEIRMQLRHYLERGVSKAELSRRFGIERDERQALRPLASHPYRPLGARQQEATARRRLVAPTVQVQRRSLREYSEAVR